jgi:hypothetical protein
MWIIALVALFLLLGSLYADWRWRRWMAARRQDRNQESREQ